MSENKFNCVVLLGPTAAGKTSLGVRLASHFGWEIVSADSRQVYKGLDLGSGKDLCDYTLIKKNPDGSEVEEKIPYHLIDVATLDEEYNCYHFQSDFYFLFNEFKTQNKMPFVVGGTGMYLDSIVRGYDFMPVEENKKLRCELEKKSLEELDEILLNLKPNLHNKSDLLIRERVVRAIEIELYMQSPECAEERKKRPCRSKINSFVIGTSLEREVLRQNIKIRLEQRMNDGMLEEVENLHKSGYSWERLEKLGLEYRYLSLYLEGKIQSREEMLFSLYHAITQFAKRQETWFRGMEKKGVKIHWLTKENDSQKKYSEAVSLIEENLFLQDAKD